MELKTARLTLLIDPNKKEAFDRLCLSQDLTPSQVVRQLIRDYLAQHGVSYVGSGSSARAQASAAEAARSTQKNTTGRRARPAAPKQRHGG